jgi:cephalosporin hydroxylase
MLKMIEHGLKNFYRPRLLPSALRALQAQTKNLTTVESAVDLAFRFRHYGIRFTPSQVPEEITSFLKLLAQRPPATILEVGTDKGGTFFLLARMATPDALLLSLDLPVGQKSAYPAWREFLYREFRQEQQRVELVRQDSHDLHTREKFADCSAGENWTCFSLTAITVTMASKRISRCIRRWWPAAERLHFTTSWTAGKPAFVACQGSGAS